MDAAEDQIVAGLRKRDLHGLARLLGAGVEVELCVEHADVVRARVVVEDPEALAAPDADMRRREHLVVLRNGGHALGRHGGRFRRDDRGGRRRIALERQRSEEGEEHGLLGLVQVFRGASPAAASAGRRYRPYRDLEHDGEQQDGGEHQGAYDGHQRRPLWTDRRP